MKLKGEAYWKQRTLWSACWSYASIPWRSTW